VKHFFSSYKVFLYLSFIFTISGCSFLGWSSDPDTANIIITASENLNPNIEKRASPVVLRIYQLTQIDKFNNSDFFALYENDQNILGLDLIYRKELEIKPGNISTEAIEISLSSKYIAVLAAFRDLDQAQWKYFIEIDPFDLPELEIELNKFNVIIKSPPQ